MMVVGVLGALLGLMAYSFAGFPFGGAAGVANARAGSTSIVAASVLLFTVGVGLRIVFRGAAHNRQ
jgi:hypothetical protein